MCCRVWTTRLLRHFTIQNRLANARANPQFQRRIGERVRDAEVAQRWPERTHNHFSAAVTSFGNEAANHHVLISANKTSS
jgi:hypothetical protein